MSESLVGRQNPYTCGKCWKITNTIHLDSGVTPFMLDCRATPDCKGMATSAFYPKGLRPSHVPEPAWEWYSPTAEELAAAKDWERDHVEQGGVLIRALTSATRDRFPEAFAGGPTTEKE